jgi:hypothetical protein
MDDLSEEGENNSEAAKDSREGVRGVGVAGGKEGETAKQQDDESAQSEPKAHTLQEGEGLKTSPLMPPKRVFIGTPKSSHPFFAPKTAAIGDWRLATGQNDSDWRLATGQKRQRNSELLEWLLATTEISRDGKTAANSDWRLATGKWQRMPDASRLLGAPTNLLEWLLATTGYQPRQAINPTGYQPRQATNRNGLSATTGNGSDWRDGSE